LPPSAGAGTLPANTDDENPSERKKTNKTTDIFLCIIVLH